MLWNNKGSYSIKPVVKLGQQMIESIIRAMLTNPVLYEVFLVLNILNQIHKYYNWLIGILTKTSYN